MNDNWLAAPSRSDLLSIKITCLNPAWKIRQFNVSFAEFGWEMAKLLWKELYYEWQNYYYQ
jgi:hypothetical protein